MSLIYASNLSCHGGEPGPGLEHARRATALDDPTLCVAMCELARSELPGGTPFVMTVHVERWKPSIPADAL